MKQITSEADLSELSRAAWSLAVLAAWADRGLLAALAEAGDPVALADLPGDTRAIRASAPVLVHLGVLHSDGESVCLSPTTRDMFDRGALAVERNLRWLGDLSRLSDVLADGGPARGPDGSSRVTKGGVRPESLDDTRRFLDGLYRRSEHSSAEACRWLMRRLPDAPHILDVGGGHGRYSERFADAGASITLFDMELVVQLARERHGDRFSYRAGDFHQADFGGPYDAAFLSNIVHGESDAQVEDMLRRLCAALRPGGWLVIKDMFIDEQGRDPAQAVYFGMTMLCYTAQGQSYRMSDVRRWCSAVGLGLPDIVTMDTHSLVFAQKPA